MSVFVIADIGACHDGSVRKMKQAIVSAAEAGCSAIKFQWTSDAARMARRRGKASEHGYADIYRKYLAWEWRLHDDLVSECEHRGIEYMCTVFLPEDVPQVAPLLRRFKVAAFEAEDPELLGAHLEPLREHRSKQLIVSLGMGALGMHVRQSLAEDVAPQVFYLHCVSSYPAPVGELSLSRIGGRDGFSDHSDPALTWTGALAVAAGAKIIEAHLRTWDTEQRNPDYTHAMHPAQFAEYVRNIRFAETCMGSPQQVALPCETQMMQYRVQG